MTTWRKEFERVLKGDKLIHNTLTEEEMDVEFDAEWGDTEGEPFTAWSEDYVYIPAQYDGSEWVTRVPRNPCKDKTNHIGGG
jgi:hypothetical protein